MTNLFFKMAMKLLRLAFAEFGMTAIKLVAEAEAQPWTTTQKFDYVKKGLLAKYGKLENYKWLVNFLIEWAVGQVTGKTAAVVK